MNWQRPIPWVFLTCEFLALVCLFGMLSLAGISAGFYWWPMPTVLAIAWLFVIGCIWMARTKRPTQRWILWAASIIPIIYFSFFIAKDSWNMAHPVTVTWVIPEGYQGPIYVIHGVSNGTKSAMGKDNMFYQLDDHGIAMVSEPAAYRWKKPTYEYVSADGKRRVIPEADVGSIDDTPANHADQTIRIYFTGAGRGGGNDQCSYEYEEAWVESPKYSFSRRNFADDLILNLQRLYPGRCTTNWSK